MLHRRLEFWMFYNLRIRDISVPLLAAIANCPVAVFAHVTYSVEGVII